MPSSYLRSVVRRPTVDSCPSSLDRDSLALNRYPSLLNRDSTALNRYPSSLNRDSSGVG